MSVYVNICVCVCALGNVRRQAALQLFRVVVLVRLLFLYEAHECDGVSKNSAASLRDFFFFFYFCL